VGQMKHLSIKFHLTPLIRLLEAGGMYEDLDAGIRMEKITIDDSKGIIK